MNEKPKSTINGKRNPEYQKWWIKNTKKGRTLKSRARKKYRDKTRNTPKAIDRFANGIAKWVEKAESFPRFDPIEDLNIDLF